MKSLFIPKHFNKSLIIILPVGSIKASDLPQIIEKWAKWARVLDASLWPICENSQQDLREIIIKMADFYNSYFYLTDPTPSEGVNWPQIYQSIVQFGFSYILQIFGPLTPELLKLSLLWENRNQNTVIGGKWNSNWKEKMEFTIKSFFYRTHHDIIQTPFWLFHGDKLKKILDNNSLLTSSGFFPDVSRILSRELEFMPFIPLEKDNKHDIRGPWELSP